MHRPSRGPIVARSAVLPETDVRGKPKMRTKDELVPIAAVTHRGRAESPGIPFRASDESIRLGGAEPMVGGGWMAT